MSSVTHKLLAAGEAADIVGKALGVNGSYYLADNRRGRQKHRIPYTSKNRRIHYLETDIAWHLAALRSSPPGLKSSFEKIETSGDVWLMAPVISDDGHPIVDIVRGAGTEALTPEDAIHLANQLRECADNAKRLVA